MVHALYMDHCVKGAIIAGLRLRGVDVLTAREDAHHEVADPLVLDRAMELERVVFTQDEDFLRDAARRQERGVPFYGVIYAHQDRVSVDRCIEDLQQIVEMEELENLVGRVIYLPI